MFFVSKSCVRHIGQILSHPRAWRSAGMERPYQWMKPSLGAIGVCTALLACRNPLGSTDRADGGTAMPAPTQAPASSSTEAGVDGGNETQQGETLGPASEWLFRVTGAVIKRSAPLSSGAPAETFSFPEDRSEKLCVIARRTGDSCCINYGGSGCSVSIQAGDLVRSGMGLSVVFHREGEVILTLNEVRFSADTVRYTTKGYALPLKEAASAPGGQPAPWGNRGWPSSLNGFLERRSE